MIPRNDPGIRWQQRLANLSAALAQLEAAVQLSNQRELSDLEKQGLIQAFEFTHELAWNVMRDYFIHQGAAELITGSRDATRAAFSQGLVANGEAWMEMIRSRNQTSHTYNKGVANEIVGKIRSTYVEAIHAFHARMGSLAKDD